MIYQPILNGATNYVVSISNLNSFPLHTHHEIEMLYCLSGKFKAIVNGEELPVEKGQMIVISSLAPHEIISLEKSRALLIEIGPFFLHENFSLICDMDFDTMLFDMRAENALSENDIKMQEILKELSEICGKKDKISDLILIGDLYKISALILLNGKDYARRKKGEKKLPAIQKALELVYYHYRENISVEDAARITNYGVSNFCKIFKSSVGISFHGYLNLYRIKCAECLLSATEKSIEEIALMSGFADQKSFSRVFKSQAGKTPSEYRKGIMR